MIKFIQERTFLFFLMLALILRAFSFGYTVIDHDESTYLVIAQQLLKGKVLYVDVWDTKPPGIFMLFALVIKIFGNSIVAIRLFATVVVATSAYYLFRVKRQLGAEYNASILAGIFYILFVTTYRFGMAANTELFFGCAVISGFYVFLSGKKYLLAGLLWGIAYVIKYVALVDLFAIFMAGFIVYVFSTSRLSLQLKIQRLILAALGFVVPFVLIFLYYDYQGFAKDFIHASFVIPGNYQSELHLNEIWDYIVNFHLKFLPFVILFYWVIARWIFMGKLQEETKKTTPIIWFVFAFAVAVFPGKYFEHYYLQMGFAMAWISSDILTLKLSWVSYLERRGKKMVIILTLLIICLVWGNQSHFFIKADLAKIAVKELEGKLKKDETIYAGNRLQVLYFLLDCDPPTKYVHPSLLTFGSHIRTLGIDANREFDHIISQRPRYIVLKELTPNQHFNSIVALNYTKLQREDEKLLIYELNVD